MTKKTKRGRPKGSGTPKKAGRPLQLTAEVQDEICECLREGNYLEVAAVLGGASKSSVYSWLKEGHKARRLREKGKELTALQRRCELFLDAIKRAEADAERDALRVVTAASMSHWQAMAWRLERRHPDRWGRRQAIEHSSPPDKPVRVQRIIMGDRVVEF